MPHHTPVGSGMFIITQNMSRERRGSETELLADTEKYGSKKSQNEAKDQAKEQEQEQERERAEEKNDQVERITNNPINSAMPTKQANNIIANQNTTDEQKEQIPISSNSVINELANLEASTDKISSEVTDKSVEPANDHDNDNDNFTGQKTEVTSGGHVVVLSTQL